MELSLRVHAEGRTPARSFRSDRNFSWARPRFGKLSSAPQELLGEPRGAVCWGPHAAGGLQTQSSPATSGSPFQSMSPLYREDNVSAGRVILQLWRELRLSPLTEATSITTFPLCSRAGQPALPKSLDLGGADGEIHSKKYRLCLKGAQGPARGL